MAALLQPVHYNTALALIAAGLALTPLPASRFHVLKPVLSGLVALIGAITLGEYLFHSKPWIDHFFFHGEWPAPALNSGRMSGISAFSLLLIGIALLLLGAKGNSFTRSMAVGSLASVIIGVCIVALLGFAFGLPDAHRWGELTRIAPLSACGMCALGLALFLTAWRDGRREDEKTPRWLPISVALGVFTVALPLYFALESRQREAIMETVGNSMETAKSQISVRVDARIRSVVRIARRWEFSGRPTEATWEHDAKEYVRELPDIQGIEWIDPSRHTQWIVPLEGNEDKLHLDLTQEPRRRAAIELARDQKQPAITRLVSLFRGGNGFVIYVPIYIGEKFDGWIASVLKPQPMLDRYFPSGVLPGQAIRVSEGGLPFYERDAGSGPRKKEWSAESTIDIHGVTWTVKVWPTPQLAKRMDSPLPIVTFVGGILCSLLLAVTVFLAQRSSTLNRATARALRDLTAAAAEIKTLTGLLPICATCKRVRDDSGYWSQIESYLSRHSDASFSHGYCPQCAANACQEFGIAIPPKIQAELEARNFEA
jgi:sensor domain CHASE-containing protein